MTGTIAIEGAPAQHGPTLQQITSHSDCQARAVNYCIPKYGRENLFYDIYISNLKVCINTSVTICHSENSVKKAIEVIATAQNHSQAPHAYLYLGDFNFSGNLCW